MKTHEVIYLAFIVLLIAYSMYSIARSQRSARNLRAEVTERTKLTMEKVAADRERHEQFRQEQTRLLSALLDEVKGLRADLKESNRRDI